MALYMVLTLQALALRSATVRPVIGVGAIGGLPARCWWRH